MLGELRRVYDDSENELIGVLNWFEFSSQIGRNLGVFILVFFSPFSIRIGSWHLNKFNFVNFIISIASLLLFIFSLVKITDVSKDLDRLINKSKKLPPQNQQTRKNETSIKTETQKLNRVSASKNTLMKYTNLNIDLTTMILSTSLIRYNNFALESYIVILSSTEYHWHSNYLFLLYASNNCLFTIIIFVLTKSGVLQNHQRCYFLYLSASIISAMLLIIFMWTRLNFLNTLPKQIALFAVVNLIQMFCYHQANTSGNYLLFTLVEPQNSGFVAGYRSFCSVFFKGIAFLTSYKAAFYPEYFSPPVVILMMVLAQVMIHRRHIYLKDYWVKLILSY